MGKPVTSRKLSLERAVKVNVYLWNARFLRDFNRFSPCKSSRKEYDEFTNLKIWR
ncbi:hypothetical protein [Leptospira alstonii]|uniref:Uncharacterized protein n=2 Tax=Leptospira alstonii TaxID=28452 RepID=M6D0N5_9LEPT|nr:hypothetical protein [Leptospira alstonii]EMJ97717.1 hypothetical protein LEP1GSC194_2003 [Leptospira alstonii serovar Sichuan str. 79601]EQA79700.1 hypothetical protein LEP1GSC193_3702 [Leptospira alstonii serovar Pingchang str. 80-412]